MSFGNEFMKMAAKQHPRSYMKYLWHGTSESSTDNINEYGFNRNYKGKNGKELLEKMRMYRYDKS